MTMRRFLLALATCLFAAAILVQPVFGQQYFQKWDMYAGYTYLRTPTNDLSQHGYNLTFGRNLKSWLALGADFSQFRGSGMQSMALPAPLSGTLHVPYDATTSTFAAGTQFQVRKTKWVTPFFRPFLGAFHMKASGKANEIQLPAGVPPQILAAIPASELKQSDTVLGYGLGSGVDLNLSKPIGLRVAVDYIRTPLFDAHQNNLRVGFGLIYRFGGQVRNR